MFEDTFSLDAVHLMSAVFRYPYERFKRFRHSTIVTIVAVNLVVGAAVAQWLASWPSNSVVAASILRASSISVEY